MKPLPDMIPSPVAPPKKLRHSNEVMLHILQSAEHPNIFLQSRPFFSLVVIVCDTNCVTTIGTISVLIFSKEDIPDSVMYVMACYSIFHLTYPKSSRTLLFVLQTEVLIDTIHAGDMTSSNKKVMVITTLMVIL
ncbi:hypothetical protein OJAV_G00236440 [Oryzias javanicus]|uniref:Uncharacterized protein n=1 Tax=Oryzias javanicus TaxID=123683 RepID=A0A437BY70_ORYJA|nr:hypothetical protein OJAV_G00236440 [Oryzias javanicus]